MAEETNTEEAQESGNKSKKKVIVIIVLVAILAVSLSVGVTIFLLTGGDDKASAYDEAVAEEEVIVPASYFAVNPAFLVTFNVEGRQRYMQVSFSVSSRDANVFTSMEYHMPLIRSKLLSAYGGMDFDVIKTEAGKIEVQLKTVEVINSVLASEGEGQIENVYFTNFVLQ